VMQNVDFICLSSVLNQLQTFEILKEPLSEYIKLTISMLVSTTEQKSWLKFTFCIARSRLV
jgi:hypothetical protein